MSSSKWPPEDWMSDSPFLFSSSGGHRADDPGRVIAAHISPLPSPGIVDHRRHSAYMRPLDQLQARQDQKELLLQQHQQQLLHSTSDYSQHSLPRQYLASKNPLHLQPHVKTGSPNTSPSPLGFSSSTLNPRPFGAHNLGFGSGSSNLGQGGVTKPSSQIIKNSSSDHESSV